MTATGLIAAATVMAFRVIVLDHHKTAQDMLNTTESQHPNLDAQIDMSRSGATIALDYFRPAVRHEALGVPMQPIQFCSLRLRKLVQITQEQRRIFEYVEDADLWRWKLPDSQAFHAGLLSCMTLMLVLA